MKRVILIDEFVQQIMRQIGAADASKGKAGGSYAAGFPERLPGKDWFRRFVSESIGLDG